MSTHTHDDPGTDTEPRAPEETLGDIPAILWRIGREHPDLDTEAQLSLTAERARERGYFPSVEGDQ